VGSGRSGPRAPVPFRGRRSDTITRGMTFVDDVQAGYCVYHWNAEQGRFVGPILCRRDAVPKEEGEGGSIKRPNQNYRVSSMLSIIDLFSCLPPVLMRFAMRLESRQLG
jgi:hypothetical protein